MQTATFQETSARDADPTQRGVRVELGEKKKSFNKNNNVDLKKKSFK